MPETPILLPFNEQKQSALLGHLILNSKAFKNVYTKIKPHWFLSEKHSKIYKFLIKYYEGYGAHPTPYEFKSYREFYGLDNKEREVLQAHISACLANTNQYRLQPLMADLTDWLHSVILLDALKDAEQQFNKQNIKECHSKLMKAVQEVNQSRFNNEEEVDFLSFKDYLVKAENERNTALTTGLSILDGCMLEGANVGGLLYGDTTCVVGPTNSGKSTWMSTVAIHNIKRNKDVFYMTHEDKKESIRLKMLSCYMESSIADLFTMAKTSEGAGKLQVATEHISKHLKYIPYNKAGGMLVENVIPIIRQTQEDWISEHDGKGFDLLVSDYPFVLSTELAYRGNLQKYGVVDIVCNNYVQLALEYNFHALIAAQTNREGFKVNRGGQLGVARRLIGMEDIRDGFGPMTQVCNVLTLNRSPEDEARNILTINLAKCRSNSKNVAVCAKTDFSHGITHSNELGAFAYTGNKTPEEQVDELIKQFKGQKIPEHLAQTYGL